ncbi:MAG: hypothetical protein QOF60_752 [Actinomycetota bacterium]|jgi:hypothetical protein|nr:hypothetical protein [Actinomycetota bacterium]
MADDLRRVVLVGLPVDIHAKAGEHSDELMREFTYLRAQADDPDAADVPARLLALVDDLQGRYGAFTAGSQLELDQAVADGRPTIDLEYNVPADVVEACRHLEELLDQADEYCMAGDHLLTMASPPDLVAYRRWFLGEFVRQVRDGGAPNPWPA